MGFTQPVIPGVSALSLLADFLGVGMLFINFDHEHMAAVRAFVKGEKLPFPVLWDLQQRVVRAYRAEAYDFSLFLVDREGIIRYLHYDHPPEVLKLLTEKVQKLLEARKVEEAKPEEQAGAEK